MTSCTCHCVQALGLLNASGGKACRYCLMRSDSDCRVFTRSVDVSIELSLGVATSFGHETSELSLSLACFSERILHNSVIYPIPVFTHRLQSCRDILQHAVPLRLHQNTRAPYHPKSIYSPGYLPRLGLIHEHYVRARC